MTHRLWCAALAAVASVALLAQQSKPPAGPAADFLAASPVVPLPTAIGAGIEALRAENLAAHIDYLAAPALEGRGMEGQGLEAAIEYAAASLALAGIPPAIGRGDSHDAYFQRVPVRAITGATARLVIERPGKAASRAVVPGADCVFPEIAPRVVAGRVAFAAYGIREASLGRDDLAGLDLRGRIALIVGGVPEGEAWRRQPLASRYGAASGRARYAAKLRALRAAGALAVIVVEADEKTRRDDEMRARYYLPETDTAEPDELPLVRISPALAALLTGNRPLDRTPPGVLDATRVTIEVAGAEHATSSRNVLAVLRGSDPVLRETAVVLGAHVDHLGRVGGAIHPGADDNASGVAALLEIARVLAASRARPARSVLFAIWTGEEEGHIGSEYYLGHPLWPLDRTDVYANLDMLAFPWAPAAIGKLVADSGLPGGGEFVARVKAEDFIEPGVAEWAPELCPVLEQAARGLGLALHFDRTDGKNGGSDYRAFARRGVRFIRFCGEYPPGYHTAADTPAATDAAQAAKIARLALATAWLLADRRGE